MQKGQRKNNQIKVINPERILGKSLPANIDAEKAVLGALLLNDENVNKVSEIILPEDFYSYQNKIIYEMILFVFQKYNRLDLVLLQDALKKKDLLESIGGISSLIALQEDIPSLGLIEQHCQIIKEKSILRDLIKSATNIITNCYDQDEKNISAVLDKAEQTIFQISSKRTSQNFVQLNIWLKKTFQHLSSIKSHS